MKPRLLIFFITLCIPSLVPATQGDLDQLMEQVRTERIAERRHHVERERRFITERDRQQARLDAVKRRIASAEARADELQQHFEANEIRLDELEERLTERAGDLTELFAVSRQVAMEVKNTIEESLVSAQTPGRAEFLEQLGSAQTQPSISELEQLWLLLLEEMNQAGKVTRFDAPVITVTGEERNQVVTRIGTFNVLSEGQYLRFLAQAGKLVELGRQPAARLRKLATQMEQADDGIHPVAVDPSRGAILGLMVQSPDPLERLQQGGVIGYIILVLGGVALLIVIQRYASIGWIQSKVNRQLSKGATRQDNPLTRIEKSARKYSHLSQESVAAHIDEAVAAEASRLHRGLPTLTILAAVTPLLGLLGTVTGMIETFQSITLFGTGDPKLMSGGISQALVTTQLGLAVAIPVLLLNSFLTGRVNSLIETLSRHSTELLTQLSGRESARDA